MDGTPINALFCLKKSFSRKKKQTHLFLLLWSNWNAVETILAESMAVWGKYLCVRQTALLKKMTSHTDQEPDDSNYFKLLWSTIQHPYAFSDPGCTLCSSAFSSMHNVAKSRSLQISSPTATQVPFCSQSYAPRPHSPPASQPWSPASHLHHFTCSSVPYCTHQHLCCTVCGADCLLIGETGRSKASNRLVCRASQVPYRSSSVSQGRELKRQTGDVWNGGNGGARPALNLSCDWQVLTQFYYWK